MCDRLLFRNSNKNDFDRTATRDGVVRLRQCKYTSLIQYYQEYNRFCTILIFKPAEPPLNCLILPYFAHIKIALECYRSHKFLKIRKP